MNSKEQINSILKLYEKRSSKQLFKDAINEIWPSKNNCLIPLILLIVSLFVAIKTGCADDTVSIFREIIELLNGVMLALFGIVFTGYSIFQALIDDELLMRLIDNRSEENQKSRLQISNEYFVNIMILMVAAILLNTILLVILICIPKDFSLFSSRTINELISILGIGSCIFFEINLIAETKSFIFNVYQIFNISAGSRAVEILKKRK